MTQLLNVRINGERHQFPAGINLQDALFHYCDTLSSQRFAVALNQQFTSKINYPITVLHDGDSIDILLPIQGG